MKLLEKLYNTNERLVIALDGPSAAGKGLIGNMIAKEFSLKYVQSSIVYRGLAYICLQKNITLENTDALIALSENEDIISQIEGVDLNIEIIGDIASKISVHNEIRKNLTKYLENLIKTTPRIIMEGRDIGTVVAPNADLKIFITANVEVRAKRRFKQLRSEGKDCRLSDVLELLKNRDERDILRKSAPLIAAGDAFIIDTSNISPFEVIEKIKNFVNLSVNRL